MKDGKTKIENAACNEDGFSEIVHDWKSLDR